MDEMSELWDNIHEKVESSKGESDDALLKSLGLDEKVTESARARSYFLSEQVQKTY